MADPALGHYRPWIEDVRKEKPYQLEDRVEQLFHEKSVTGHGRLEPAVRRDHRGAALQGRRQGAADRADPQPAAGPRRARTARRRPRRWRKTFTENLRTFTLITNTLAKDKEISDRWRGFADIADARHLANRVEPEVVEALVAAVREAYPRLSHRYYALKARWFGKKRLPHWDRNAPLPEVPTAHNSLDGGAGHRAVGLWGVLAEDGRRSPSGSSPSAGSMRRCVRASRRARSRIRPCRRRILIVLLNYQGKPRDVMTLAHELGHGVHQVLAAPNGAPDGADAADAGRDRERVRRDADLPRLLAATKGPEGSARRCSPPRSRT